MTCSVDQCQKPAKTAGLCGAHYQRTLRGRQSPDEPLRIVGQGVAARFWPKVQEAGALECWLWTGSLKSSGYGQIYKDGRPHAAHRVAYELLIGEIPEGLVLDHLCRVRTCVNPWHLDPVTDEVNIARGVFSETKAPSKTHCRNGHEFTERNVRLDPEGYRRCRTCERAQSLAGYRRRVRAA